MLQDCVGKVAKRVGGTYGNAVYNEWRELIEEINDKASDIISDFDETAEECDDTDALETDKRAALRTVIEEVAGNA